MLSAFMPYTTGELIRVDGGYHASGAEPVPEDLAPPAPGDPR